MNVVDTPKEPETLFLVIRRIIYNQEGRAEIDAYSTYSRQNVVEISDNLDSHKADIIAKECSASLLRVFFPEREYEDQSQESHVAIQKPGTRLIATGIKQEDEFHIIAYNVTHLPGVFTTPEEFDTDLFLQILEAG